MLLILYDVKNMLKIARLQLVSNARKKYIKFKK